MTVLYVSPGACSLAAHSLVRELDLPILVETVALRVAGSPIHRINPLGRVPALQLDDGTLITENSAILPYLADLRPDSGLIAPAGSAERALTQSWIGYLTSEVHVGGFRPLNRPERYSADEAAHPGIRTQAAEQLYQALAHIDRHLANRSWLVGERYTIADAYLGVFAGWLPRLGERFADLHNLARAREAFQSRPATRQALAAEGQR
jgi:glutathione S-transferase